MLQSLNIKNVALIKNLSLDFGPKFNVLLGETGAGKSIIFGRQGHKGTFAQRRKFYES